MSIIMFEFLTSYIIKDSNRFCTTRDHLIALATIVLVSFDSENPNKGRPFFSLVATLTGRCCNLQSIARFRLFETEDYLGSLNFRLNSSQ